VGALNAPMRQTILPTAPQYGKEAHMKRIQLVISALTLSSVGAFAAANDTSATTASSSSQSYTASIPNDNSQVSQIQQALNDQGYNVGAVDGQMGPKTRAALKQFQQAKGLQASGKLDQQTVAMLTTSTGSSGTSSNTSSSSNTTSSDTSAPSTTPGMTTGATSPNSPTSPSSSSNPPSSDNSGFSPQTPPSAQGK
jgi:peptidoglycan hydrolase-like protein with peptidoglycan-binding domain